MGLGMGTNIHTLKKYHLFPKYHVSLNYSGQYSKVVLMTYPLDKYKQVSINNNDWLSFISKTKWVWQGNGTIKDCRPTYSHNTTKAKQLSQPQQDERAPRTTPKNKDPTQTPTHNGINKKK